METKILCEVWGETKTHMGDDVRRVVAVYSSEWATVTLKSDWFGDMNRALHELEKVANAIAPGWGDVLSDQFRNQRHR